MKKWIDSLMTSEKRVAVPIMTHPGIEYIGKTVREAVTDGEVHASLLTPTQRSEMARAKRKITKHR